MQEELKKIYLSLAKGIETGDNLKIGIVIGQVLCKLEELINVSYNNRGDTVGIPNNGRAKVDE